MGGGKYYPNDYRPSGLLPSVGTYVTANDISGRIVIYRQYATNPVWFDRWNHYNSVEEQPSGTLSDISASLVKNNGSVTVSFSVSSDAWVNIEVYDALGRKVNSLADGVYSSGNSHRCMEPSELFWAGCRSRQVFHQVDE
ncbi:hypothetical protein JXA84_06770 [candidate division WOR-3 bacterium]|nr:hypothetical protein [candidate division WOR-3 bacterium]